MVSDFRIRKIDQNSTWYPGRRTSATIGSKVPGSIGLFTRGPIGHGFREGKIA
jgi:hypothetical protein